MKNTTIVSTALGLGLMTLTACAPTGFQAVTSAPGNGKSDIPIAKEQCVPDATDYELNLNVFAFEMFNKTQGSVGFNANLGWFKGISLGFKVEGGALDISGSLTNPLKGTTAAALKAEGKMSKSEFSFTIDTSVANVGLGTANHTSLTKLSSLAIKNILADATTKIAQQNPEWSTHITKTLSESQFYIPVGALAGLRRGDAFKIWDYKYFWADESNPCHSRLLTGARQGTAAIATAVVWDLDADTATLQLVGSSTAVIHAGAQVIIENLPKSSKKEVRSLKRSVHIKSLSQSGRLKIDGSGEIDISMYLQQMVPAMLSDTPFWLAQ